MKKVLIFSVLLLLGLAGSQLLPGIIVPTILFAREWDGTGSNPDLVDPDRLRDEWLSPEPSAQTALLLQAAWLATHSSSAASP